VPGGLAAGELQLVASEHHRRAAELGDADLERGAGARGGLLEDDRDALALERPRPVPAGALHFTRALDHGDQLVAPKLRAGYEMERLAHIEILDGGSSNAHVEPVSWARPSARSGAFHMAVAPA